MPHLKTIAKYTALGGAFTGAVTAGVLEETPAVPSGNEIYLQEVLLPLYPFW